MTSVHAIRSENVPVPDPGRPPRRASTGSIGRPPRATLGADGVVTASEFESHLLDLAVALPLEAAAMCLRREREAIIARGDASEDTRTDTRKAIRLLLQAHERIARDWGWDGAPQLADAGVPRVAALEGDDECRAEWSTEWISALSLALGRDTELAGWALRRGLRRDAPPAVRHFTATRSPQMLRFHYRHDSRGLATLLGVLADTIHAQDVPAALASAVEADSTTWRARLANNIARAAGGTGTLAPGLAQSLSALRADDPAPSHV